MTLKNEKFIIYALFLIERTVDCWKLDIIRRVEKGSEEGEFLSLDEAEEAWKE